MNRQRIFICHVVPKSLIEKLPVSPAGNYFSYNLISGNLFDKVISLVPTNIKQKIITKNTSIIFVQNRFFPHISFFKTFNIFLENIYLILSIEKHSAVWFYNLTIHTFFPFLILRYFRRSVKTYIIVLDYSPSKNVCSIKYWILKCINTTNGIISLSSSHEIRNKNKIVIPGIVPQTKYKYPIQSQINNAFLLSGILTENRSPKQILDTFSRLPQYTLKISGIVEDESMFIYYANTYSNIHYLGFLPYDKYIELLKEVSFAINSRNESFEENLYNFPSKMIEYLLYNKIVVSTMFYPQLEGINYIYQKANETLFDLFKKIGNIDKKILLQQYANQSALIIERMSTSRWMKSMIKIENYCSK
jgi:hypothetical protein